MNRPVTAILERFQRVIGRKVVVDVESAPTRERSLRGCHRKRSPREDYILALRQPLKNPQLYLEAMEWVRVDPPPDYTCFFCRKKLTRKPIHDFTLQTIVDGLSRDGGETPSPGDGQGGIEAVDGFFDKYFLF